MLLRKMLLDIHEKLRFNIFIPLFKYESVFSYVTHILYMEFIILDIYSNLLTGVTVLPWEEAGAWFNVSLEWKCLDQFQVRVEAEGDQMGSFYETPEVKIFVKHSL